MLKVPAKQAVEDLDNLLNKAALGQEIVIISANGAAFKIQPLPRNPQPIFGSAKGLVKISPDFDDPIDGFEEYMP